MQLKIASYNVHKAVGRDRRRDPARILAVLNQIEADVVVLQEADRRMGARPSAIPRALIEADTDYAVADLARNSVSLGWHGNAILVKRDLPIAGTQHMELPGLEPRGAVLVRLADLTVVGTHLGLLRTWRHRQMRAILGHLGASTQATVIAGDFNEWSDVRGFEPWEEKFTLVSPGPTFPTRRPIASLDAIAHGPGVRVRDHGVMRAGKARIASDHLPIWATLDIGGPQRDRNLARPHR